VTDRLPAPIADVARVGAARASATPQTTVRSARRGLAAETRRDVGLRDTQAWMLDAITGDGAAADLAPSMLTAGPQLDARERLEIYRSAYRSRLVECLADDYPVLALALGEERFHALCHAYTDRFPSTSPNLNAFGRHMAELSRDVESVFASDLARLEWALVEVLHAECPATLDLAALQAIAPDAWGRARLVAGDALRVLRFEYPVNAFYTACKKDEHAPPIPSAAPCAAAVYRTGPTLWRMDLTPAMTRVLEALVAGVPIADALARMEHDETDPAALAEAERSVMIWFREWVSSGFFARVDVEG
jgi:hypothetical protein